MKNNILCFTKFFVKNNDISKKSEFEEINEKFIHFNITSIKYI